MRLRSIILGVLLSLLMVALAFADSLTAADGARVERMERAELRSGR
jgi:hypothetical protein